MEIKKISQLTNEDVGKSVIFTGNLTKKQVESENGTYYTVSVKDGTGTVVCNVFQNKKNEKVLQLLSVIEDGAEVRVQGILKEAKNSKDQVNILSAIQAISEIINYQDNVYILHDTMKELSKEFKTLKPEHKEFVKVLLQQNPEFWTMPFSDRNYYNFTGGLATYTLKMINIVNKLQEEIDLGDISLLKTIIFVHRIGKTKTLSLTNSKAKKTLKGDLNDDTVYSIALVANAIASCKEFKESKDVDLLLHAVASTKDKEFFGAQTMPLIYESKMLFLLEAMVLKENQYKNIQIDGKSNFTRCANGEYFYINKKEGENE